LSHRHRIDLLDAENGDQYAPNMITPTSRLRFQTAAALTALIAVIGIPSPAAAADSGKQYYELRIYSTKSEQQQKLVSDHWQNAAVPAYNRMGIQPIGVFTEQQDSATNKVYVLIPCDSLDAFAAIPARLASDAVYQKAAAEYLNLTKPSAAYERFESALLVAFDGMKKMAVPSSGAKRPEVFELRTYMAPSEGKGVNKVQMFNNGEIAVMQEVGLSPIFYGQTIVGSPLPSLVYMTSGENLDEHKKHWQSFSDAPAWAKLRNDPQYKDNYTGMIRVMLKRTSASQI
jgi:hypothetical protein